MQTVTPPVASIFGDGAPSDPAQNGVRYFDTSVSPYQEYVCFGGVWQGPLGGGGSSGGNIYSYAPYGVVFGYAFAFVPVSNYGPYVFLRAGDGANDAAYSAGGNVYISTGAPGTAPREYSGDVQIFTENAAGDYSYGGDISIAAGSGIGTNYGTGGTVVIQSGYGSGGTYGYGGDILLDIANGSYRDGRLTIQNLPIAPPLGANHVWNNLGVLTIT